MDKLAFECDITTHFNRCNMSLNVRLLYAAEHFCIFLKKFLKTRNKHLLFSWILNRKGLAGQVPVHYSTEEGGELNGIIFFPSEINTTSV